MRLDDASGGRAAGGETLKARERVDLLLVKEISCSRVATF